MTPTLTDGIIATLIILLPTILLIIHIKKIQNQLPLSKKIITLSKRIRYERILLLPLLIISLSCNIFILIRYGG